MAPMTAIPMSPFEVILRLCSQAAPQPWYPRDHCEQHNVARETLDPLLDQLRLDGFVELTDWVAGHGQGYRLTPNGKALLGNERALARLREGRLPVPEQRYEPRPEERYVSEPEELHVSQSPVDAFQREGKRRNEVRKAFQSPERAVVVLILGILNVMVFLWGLTLAERKGAQAIFLKGMLSGKVEAKEANIYTDVLRETGAAEAQSVLAGDWWRLVTCCFVHLGWLHIGCNSYALYAFGPLTEQMYGRWRFLLLYLVSGIGGSVLGIYFLPQNGLLAGASGAICGLLGGMLSWTMLNRKYMPPSVRSQLNSWMLKNIVLVGVFSIMANVSWAGHLGGGLVGLAAGVLLTVNRFGPSLWRVPALAATVLLGVLLLAGFKPFLEAAAKDRPQVSSDEKQDETVHEEREKFNREIIPHVNAIKAGVDTDQLQEAIRQASLDPGERKRPRDATMEPLRTAVAELATAEEFLKGAQFKSDQIKDATNRLLATVEARKALYAKCLDLLKNREADPDSLQQLRTKIESAEKRWHEITVKVPAEGR
jgi:rhomboid protease GluP